MLDFIKKFINYWYFRYLLVTELYMVEKWERVMFHMVFLTVFLLTFLFNFSVTLALVSWLKGCLVGNSDITDSPVFQATHSLHVEM